VVAAVAAVDDDTGVVEPDRELFTAWRRRVAGSVAVGEAPVLPNKLFASTSCCASWLNLTISRGAAFFSADCTTDEDRAEESDPIATPDSV
jgi:hypothetical protein